MMLTIIHPSRGRGEKSWNTYFKWAHGIEPNVDVQWILSLDADDDLSKYHLGIEHTINKNRSAVDAINNAAKIAKGDILMVVSDDTECPEDWYSRLMSVIKGKKDFICKVQDGTQPWIITMPIMDRAYYNRFGYIYNPGYHHMFADTEITCVADLTGRKLVSNILFKHNHYSVTKEQRDAVSIKADSTWDQGEKLFLERYKRNFDLPPDQIKGKILDNGMINWLQRKVR